MEVLKMTPVETIRDSARMRIIRNECREFMTRDTSKIGIFRQAKWFIKTYRPLKERGVMTAYLGWYNKRAVAYGIVRYESDRPLISGGLLKQYRGKGLGRRLFSFLTEKASEENGKKKVRSVFLEVLATNRVALSLYEQLGYVRKAVDDGVIHMQKDWGEFE